MSGSEGGMLAVVDLLSTVVELDDLMESVELLVALGGGQSGGNSSFSWLSALSQLFLFSQGSSCGSNAGFLSQKRWLLVVDIMHLNWRQSTQIGARRIEFTPLLCLGCRERLEIERGSREL
eukprot:scaffold19579_cov52-Attheya_sp.AAC.1